MTAVTRDEHINLAMRSLRIETAQGFAALQRGDLNEARRHVAMGAYYLGHLHALAEPQRYSEWSEHSDDPDDDRFHSLMNHVDKELRSRG